MNTTILSITTPPGQPIKKNNIAFQKLDAQINFAFNSESIKPFSPLVQASYSSDSNLQISAVIFIASSEEPNFSGVNQESVISDEGETQLDFFIIYDAPEKSNQIFNAYRVDFVVENPPKDLEQIQTFLWDKDPVSSRGTKTKV
ncbi:hypothetical protein APS56_08220 [Pseudalgibacter alginicilyticus]|uniref:Uncharacterized protein n=1 Tax=Pseudalgibacter alginicilyticus TaxID=1736674 RepID=A0A0N7HYF5_9FLAO|nr:hypothetical protein [Pseudalgibacter alginicilyticus]ALJ05110.1 hypothetical protein APS56_08220 [Pseudalgibacter alginicilyticus]